MKTTLIQLANGYYVTHVTCTARMNVTEIGITPDIRQAHEHYEYIAGAVASYVRRERKMGCRMVKPI